MFIMTIRRKFTDSQLKLTIENNKCYAREYRLYPNQKTLLSEVILQPCELIAIVGRNLAAHAAGLAEVNVYFNGDNFKKFVDNV